MENNKEPILAFSLDNIRFALFLQDVLRVIRAMAVSPVPKAAPSIYGLIDLKGEHIPVVNLRERFGLPKKAISPSDRLIISLWNKRKLAILVDDVDQPKDISRGEVKKLQLPDNHTAKQESKDAGLTVIDTTSDEKGLIIIYDLPKLLGHEIIVAVDLLFSLLEKEG